MEEWISRAWENYPTDYRQREMQILADWIQKGISGTVVGLPGSGTANLLGFLCHRPNVLSTYFPQTMNVVLLPVDLNNLPIYNLSTFYRVILRAFYEEREQFEPEVGQRILELYDKHQAIRDPFLAQSALREILILLRSKKMRLVMVLIRFDKFCQKGSPYMFDTLRGLRDSFKEVLTYIVGMSQETNYLDDPSVLGELYELVDAYTCWLHPMTRKDASQVIKVNTLLSPFQLEEDEADTLVELTGGFPALLKAACYWWLETKEPDPTKWESALLLEPSIQYRLRKIWQGLSQEEQFLLAEIEVAQKQTKSDQKRSKVIKEVQSRKISSATEKEFITQRLQVKGVLHNSSDGWQLFSRLFAAYIHTVADSVRGRISYDERTNEFFQGQEELVLTRLESLLLKHLVRNHKIIHSADDLIAACWPDEAETGGVSNQALYQLIRSLRKKIEPDASQPNFLISSSRGYRFFPEGRPS